MLLYFCVADYPILPDKPSGVYVRCGLCLFCMCALCLCVCVCALCVYVYFVCVLCVCVCVCFVCVIFVCVCFVLCACFVCLVCLVCLVRFKLCVCASCVCALCVLYVCVSVYIYACMYVTCLPGVYVPMAFLSTIVQLPSGYVRHTQSSRQDIQDTAGDHAERGEASR